jgi:hypothetical protein
MIDFIEAKFTEHGVTKLVPDAAVLEAQARYTFERLLLKREIDKIAPKIRDIAARKSLPRNLEAEVEELLADQPSVSWDQAVAAIAERNLKR